uniref:JmjC domain-containing protein n=1 Tax=Spumella elongata TaxID=89044 RepID=A0A7S3GSE1_9STRA|eukprot:CAMPEP_0185004760 /NCGR_PEP_ID=MMETSP1098-20130426/80154_1 /TAXON_ID=89044 /ORGANISM="Spumella elongata, Strain CCAP 955/1" /LENGTH=683 /DNA_ID=CAMNT_0027532633 /DNA_START=56 /DNA_END=2107 /DNA_ORIENTATION=+
MDAQTVSTRSKQLSNLLLKSVSDPAKMDLPMAKKLLSQFNATDSLVGYVNDEIPVLHHLLNLHRLSGSAREKSDLLDIFIACMKVGADPSVPYAADPPLLFKTILLKEFHLAKLISSNSSDAVRGLVEGRVQWSSLFFTQLYSTPSESVPLAKLLLHADTIVRSKGGQDAMGGLEGVRTLLSSASLGKPAVKSIDLDIYSATYARILATIGASEGALERKVYLLDLIRSLDEISGTIHQAILGAVLHDHRAAVRLVQVLTNYVMSATGVTESAYPKGRNALHYLSLSGGAVMLNQLAQFVLDLRGGLEVPSAVALENEGTPSPAQTTCIACEEMLKEALQCADQRGHTPVSYAMMRFSAESPAADALRNLCRVLGLDFDQLVAHAQENNILRDASAGSDTSAGELAPSADGGWQTKRLASGDAFVAAKGDARIAEVHVETLPDNKNFFAQYLNTGTPAIFRRKLSSSADEKDSVLVTQKVFEKEHFLSQYGDVSVPAASIPYASSFGITQMQSTIRQVANSPDTAEAPLYTFCTPSPQWAPRLLTDVPVPRSIHRLKGREGDSGVGEIDPVLASWNLEIQFYLGAAGTGAPVHFHGHALNTLAYGEKQWLLYPPVNAFYSTKPSQELFSSASADAVDESGAIRVTQRAGDVLYVPPLWGHATLNTAQSIGVAHEFSVESFCME